MKLPLSLIKQFIDTEASIEEISTAITKSGIEVDGIENPTPPFSGVVAAKIVSKQKHPDADKLTLLKVFDGKEELDIVCGAPNCKENMIVALATIGAKLIDETGKEWKIKKSKIRGQISLGMLCTKNELKISEDHEELLELPEKTELGQDLLNILWDPVFELSLTPNLGHCFSAKGVAKELSSYLNTPLKKDDSSFKNDSKETIEDKLSAEISSINCDHYCLKYVENITVASSPFWLSLILERAGLRSVNNVVDVTNLVMLELGQPLHAFDYDLIEGKSIEVADLKEQIEFDCLDQMTRKIPKGTCVIQDENKPIAIAGIIGGKNSSVSKSTKAIVLEAATFNATSIRKSARKIGLRTDSAQRFEKMTDSQLPIYALEKACTYLQQIAGAKVFSGSISIEKKPYQKKTIELRIKRASDLLGKPLSKLEIEKIFNRLQFPFESKETSLLINIPSNRNDLNIEEDLIEEIAKLYGYENLKGGSPLYTTTEIPHSPMYLFENRVREVLIQQGLTEFLTCDLISPKLKNLLHEKNIPDSSIIEVLQAKSIDFSLLRPSLLPGLLQSVSNNFSFKNKDIQAFEIGKAHLKVQEGAILEGNILEPTLFSIIMSGKTPSFWNKKEERIDFYDIKGILENIFQSLGQNLAFIPSVHSSFHPHRQAEIYLKDVCIGTVGQLHPQLCKKLSINEEIYFSEIEMEPLLENQKEKVLFENLHTQPSSERDVTLSLDKKVLASDIFAKIEKAKPKILEKAFVTDLFEGEKIGTDKKNITIRFVYRDPIRTLAFEEVETAHQKLMEMLSAE